MNLRDNRPDDGGTLVVPRPPASFDVWLKTQPTTQRTRGAMQFMVGDDDPLWAGAQRVRCRCCARSEVKGAEGLVICDCVVVRVCRVCDASCVWVRV